VYHLAKPSKSIWHGLYFCGVSSSARASSSDMSRCLLRPPNIHTSVSGRTIQISCSPPCLNSQNSKSVANVSTLCGCAGPHLGGSGRNPTNCGLSRTICNWSDQELRSPNPQPFHTRALNAFAENAKSGLVTSSECSYQIWQ